MIAALIFDVDGTLAETEEVHRLAFNAAFADAGLSWHWDEAMYARLLEVTGGKERMRHFIAAYGGAPALDDAAIAALHAAKTRHYTDAVAGGMALRPGIARLLDEAAARGVPVAIATTTSFANVEALLATALGANAKARFAAIGAGDDVRAKKPAPDVYEMVVRALGVPAAACVAIEDTPNGLRAALGAGVPCVVTQSLYGGTAGFSDALSVLDHLGDHGAPCAVVRGAAPAGPFVTLDDLGRWIS